MHFTDLEFFTASRTTHFHAVGQYLDSISGRLESSFVLEQDTPINQTGHLAREILVLFDSILKSPWSGGDKEALLALSSLQENGNRRVIKLISSSIFYPQNIANDADSSRKYLTPAAAQLLRTLTKDHGSSKIARLGEEAVACLRGLIALPKFDLGAINLESAQGCIAAQRLTDGYRKLANVLVLRSILPKEGESSAKNLTRRAATVVRNLFHANPPQRVVGQVVMQLCLHLNIAPSTLLCLLFDREVEDSDAKLGETFYRNYREPIVRACKYSFDDYACELFEVAGTDVQSPSGAVATDIIVSVIGLSIPKENAEQTRSLDGGCVLATLKKNMSQLRHLYEDHEDASAIVKNTCHQRFLAILRAAVKLNRTLGPSYESIASEDSYTSFLTVMAGLMRCVRCDCISLSSQVDAVMIAAEILEGINMSKSSRDALEKSLSDSLKNMVVQERCDSTTFKRRFPSTVKAFKQAFSTYQAPSLIAALLPFYDDSDSKSLLLQEDVTEIRWNAAVAQRMWLIAEDEHVAFESRALAVCRILPKLLSSSDPAQVLAFFTDNSEAIAQDIGGGKTDILLRLRTFGVLSAMYSKCTKQEVMDGPCVQIPKLNALVSKAVISELSGHGTASKSLLGQESIALHATKMAFSVFASLLTCTQTNIKFYAKLFENVASWNNLVDRKKRVELEATMEVKRAQRDSKADSSTTRLKSFTLSSNLAAMYSLKPPDTVENDNLDDEDIAQQDDHPKGTPRDELEAHPVSDGVFKMLKLAVTRGLTGDASGLRPEMQLLEMVSCLLYSPAVLASVKLLVVKALLRLNDDLTSESCGDVGMTVLITQPSFLAAHSDVMIALLSAMIEITKESDAAYVSTPLRKTMNIALECDNLWSSNFEEAKTSIFEATELVIKSGYSRNEDIFRENLKLCSKLFSRLRDTARMTGTPTSHCFQSSMYHVQRHLECTPKDPRNTSLVKVCALRKKFAIKLVEILINAEAPVLCVRDTSVFITTAQGKKIDEEIPSPLLNILLRFIDKGVRKGLTNACCVVTW